MHVQTLKCMRVQILICLWNYAGGLTWQPHSSMSTGPGARTQMCICAHRGRHRIHMQTHTWQYMGTDSQMCMWLYAFEMESIYLLVWGYQCIQTKYPMPLHGDTHIHSKAWKAVLASSSPGRCPSQLMAFAMTQVHTFSLEPPCLCQFVWLQKQSWSLWSGLSQVPTAACPLHTQPFLSPGALLSAGKELRLKVINSLFSLQQHWSVQGPYSDFKRTKLLISLLEDAVLDSFDVWVIRVKVTAYSLIFRACCSL